MKPINNDSQREESLAQIIERAWIYRRELAQLCIFPHHIRYPNKIRLLYTRLIELMNYDYRCLDNIDQNGLVYPTSFTGDGPDIPVPFRNFATSNHSQAALIHRLGICVSLSRIFADLCLECKFQPVGLVYGRTPLAQHVWNYVTIKRKRYHVDVTYGLYARDRFQSYHPEQIKDFCLVTTKQLLSVSPRQIERYCVPDRL